MKNSKFTKGFTLIELLVVVAIIGILAAIVYAPLQTALRKGRDAKKISEMKTIQSSLMMYADSNNGNYPDNLTQLASSTQGGIPKNANLAATVDLNKYNYIAYKETTSGDVRGYHLYVHLETKSPALDGAAKCRGYFVPTGGGTAASQATACFVTTSGITLTGTTPEPSATEAYFLQSERNTNPDADQFCAGDVRRCIYDIAG